MAWLDRRRLACRGCGTSGDAVFVVGTGPNSGPNTGPNTGSGNGPAYVTLQDAGPWVVEETTAHPFFAGRLFCPGCGAEVLNRSAHRET